MKQQASLRIGLALASAIAAAAVAAPAVGAPQSLVLSPANTLAQTHSHAIVMNVTSTYKMLSGTLLFDPEAKTCSIDARFVVSSLTAPNALIRAQIMSKNFLDPVDYPLTQYQGVCQGDRLIGSLTLRGQTHPFDMNVTYLGDPNHPSAIRAEGTFNRSNWGIYGLRLTVSQVIRVTNDISLNGLPPVPAN